MIEWYCTSNCTSTTPRWLLAGLLVAFGATATSTAFAETRTTANYIAIDVEAEDRNTGDDRWVLTEAGTAQQEQDPDGNHSDQAAGGAYLELLPDVRVTHDDEFGPPTAFWDVPGTGPKAAYPLNFPEAGRYYVHIRAYSTGTEDNGIHVGLNNSWPGSGARMQFCTAGNGWSWSGRQRDSGNGGACGIQKSIWLTVPDAGMHTVYISAREDGFEIDRLMLIKDKSSNTQICSPVNANDINCVSGSLGESDDVVDLDVAISSDQDTGAIGDEFELTLKLWNRDVFDHAQDVELNLPLNLDTEWELVSMPGNCVRDGSSLVCSIGEVEPTVHLEERTLMLTVKALEAGMLDLMVSTDSGSVDENTSNDVAQIQIDIDGEAAATTELQSAITVATSGVYQNTDSDLEVTVSNIGDAPAMSVVSDVILPTGLALVSLPSQCSGSQTVHCELGDIETGQSLSFRITLSAASVGGYPISVSSQADNANSDTASKLFTVVSEAVQEEESNEVPAVDPGEPEMTDSSDDDAGAAGPWMALLFAAVLAIRTHNRRRLQIR